MMTAATAPSADIRREWLEALTRTTHDERVRDLAAFVRHCTTWTIPSHQQEICRALEWVEATPGARLVITMPPRHGKSELASVHFPAWALGRNQAGLGPINRVGIAAYNKTFAASFSQAARDLYAVDGAAQAVFCTAGLGAEAGARWSFAGTAANRPNCVADGIGGGFTGLGFDLLIIDDPIKTAEEAYSPTYRERNWRWWSMVARSRLQPGGRVVVIMTRWHEDDLVGRLLQKGGWEVLHLPALDDDGQALWPEQFPAETLLELQGEDLRAFSAQYQGNPTPADGDVWRLDWFDGARYEPGTAPEYLLNVVTAWDTAYETSATSDYTAWCRVGLDAQGHLWVLDVGRRRMHYTELRRAIAEGLGYPVAEPALVEYQASGRSAVQDLASDCLRPVIKVKAGGESKSTRAYRVTSLAESGRLHVPMTPAGEELLAELLAFPAGMHDDRHDALVHAAAYLQQQWERGRRTGRLGGIR